MTLPSTSQRVALYDPLYEHDGCGVAGVARLNGQPAHETVVRALTALERMEHRGAEGWDAALETGPAC
jgi:glutamate synthase domain-containing protein 1